MYFFQNIQAEDFFLQKNILKIKVPVFGVRKTFFFFLKGKKKTVVSMFCASNQVKSLELDR